MSKLGFSKSFLIWTPNYVSNWKQFVQIDDQRSDVEIKFGVPQGSILGPVLFNIYVGDLQEIKPLIQNVSIHADDTTLYLYAKAANLKGCEKDMSATLQQLSLWQRSKKQKDKISDLLDITDVSSTQYGLLLPRPFPWQSSSHIRYLEHTRTNT